MYFGGSIYFLPTRKSIMITFVYDKVLKFHLKHDHYTNESTLLQGSMHLIFLRRMTLYFEGNRVNIPKVVP